MIGHNSTGTAVHQLNSAIAGLGLALQDARTIRKDDRRQMAIVARHLLAVDEAAANDEALSDAQIRAAGVILTSDLLANRVERSIARWLARGGVIVTTVEKNLNEIKDLEVGSLNPVEARFMTGKKFDKVTSYSGVYTVFIRECKTEIRKALDGGEGATTLDDIRKTYSDTLFLAATVETWIDEENYRRSDEYTRVQELKKAWGLRIEEAIDEARKANNVQALDRLADQVKKQLAQVRAAAAKQRAEKEAKENAAKLSVSQRRTIAEGLRSSVENPVSQDVTDEDF